MRHRRHARQAKPLFSSFIVGLSGLCLFLALVAFLIFSTLLTSPNKNDNTSQVFVIEKGESALSISERLYESGLIRSSFAFRLLLRINALGNRLQAGTYSLSPSLPARELANSLTRGFSDLRLTIPEGFRREQIADLIESTFSFSSADFLAATKGKEGYLFPDTYFLAPSSDIPTILASFQTNFNNKLLGLSYTEEDIILASLVERETKGDAEKPIVAGILKKRLAAGWPLELDATIQYIVGNSKDWWPNTTLLDRKLSSPYNTYLHPGLPPGPISNPGLASIKAVLEPVETPYWFYLHDDNGVIHYGETNAEHSDNINNFLR
ncbi:MAG: endolytic transglycosylase MltG [bacterium]